MRANNIDSEVKWTTFTIDISGFYNICLNTKIAETGSMESTDYIKGYYTLDGGSEIPWFTHTGDLSLNNTWYDTEGSCENLPGGSTLIFTIKVVNNTADEYWRFHGVFVEGQPNTYVPSISITESIPAWEQNSWDISYTLADDDGQNCTIYPEYRVGAGGLDSHQYVRPLPAVAIGAPGGLKP